MKVEIRADGTAQITGYVNVVGRESRVLHDVSGPFVEVIEPGTFRKALETTDNIGLMFNHMRLLDGADHKADLREDNIGLYANVAVSDEEVITQARANKLTGWSFGFYIGNDKWDIRADGMRRRTITELELLEVSILDVTPAYIATSIEMRGDEPKLKERRDIGDAVELVDNSPVEPADPTPNLGLEQQKLLKRKFDFYLLCN